MNPSLRKHLEQQDALPDAVISEVCAMFANEASDLLDGLARLNPTVRDTVLVSLRDYYRALGSNNAHFPKVAANDPGFVEKRAA